MTYTEKVKPARFKYQLTDWVGVSDINRMWEPFIKYNDYDYAVIVKKNVVGEERYAIFTKGERMERTEGNN